MTASLIAFAGWAGAGCMLLAYALLSTNRIPAGPVFQTLNLSGAFGLLLNGTSHHAWPSVALNLVWLLISLTAMAQQHDRASDLARVVRARARQGSPRMRSGGRVRYFLHRSRVPALQRHRAQPPDRDRHLAMAVPAPVPGGARSDPGTRPGYRSSPGTVSLFGAYSHGLPYVR